MEKRQYTSNLINDEDLAGRFNAEAFIAARNLRSKYYSLFEFMTEEDIVMECWDKIMRQDIGFDTSRNCKFESFVRMMVNNRCIDMCRKIQKHEGVLSLDAKYSSSKGDTSTLSDYLPDISGSDWVEEVEIESVIDSIDRDFEHLRVRDVMELMTRGYKQREIVKELGLRSSDVRMVKDKIPGILKRRCNGTCETLADILYGDWDTLIARQDELVSTLSFVKDTNGVCLSDVVRLVILGYTYDEIGDELGVGGMSIKKFLDRCSAILI